MTDQRGNFQQPNSPYPESTQEPSRAENLMSQAKEKAGTQVKNRATQSSKHLEPIAEVLQTAAQQLDEKGEGWAANYARQAASQLERATGYLRDEDAPAMMADLENTARAHPGTFVGTAFASGVALGRFLRSSRPKDDDNPTAPEAASYYAESERTSPFYEGSPQ